MGGVGEEDGDDVSDEMFVLIEIMVVVRDDDDGSDDGAEDGGGRDDDGDDGNGFTYHGGDRWSEKPEHFKWSPLGLWLRGARVLVN